MEFFAFLDALPSLTVRPFGTTDLPGIRTILARFSDQSLTIADAHGLAIMKDRGTAICWSTDRHLGLTGAKLAIAI